MKHLRKKQARRRAIEAAGSERGTMSIEMVVLVPVLLLITMVAVAGGRIVSVSCRVKLSDLGLVFLPGTTVVKAESSAPVDQWRGTR